MKPPLEFTLTDLDLNVSLHPLFNFYNEVDESIVNEAFQQTLEIIKPPNEVFDSLFELHMRDVMNTLKGDGVQTEAESFQVSNDGFRARCGICLRLTLFICNLNFNLSVSHCLYARFSIDR